MTTQVFSLTAIPGGRDPTSAADAARSTSYLVFEVDGQPYALPIDQIERLMRLGDVVLRPGSKDAPAGELGRLVTQDYPQGLPVASLRSLWGLPTLASDAHQNWQAILVVRWAGQQHALLVDECRCVLSQLPQGDRGFRFPTELRGDGGQAFDQATAWAQSLLVVLDLEALLRPITEAYPSPETATVAMA